MTHCPAIIEVGIPQASFDPGVVFVTDIQLEVIEVPEYNVLKLFRNLNVTPNTQGDFYHIGKKLKCHTEFMAPVDRLQGGNCRGLREKAISSLES
ncbi:hypothetical protein Tco_1222819 [Tanacetum coccineum]